MKTKDDRRLGDLLAWGIALSILAGVFLALGFAVLAVLVGAAGTTMLLVALIGYGVKLGNGAS